MQNQIQEIIFGNCFLIYQVLTFRIFFLLHGISKTFENIFRPAKWVFQVFPEQDEVLNLA